MIRISYWARSHKIAARALLGTLHTLLFAATVYIAVLLDQIDVHIHYSVPVIASILSVAAILFYVNINPAKASFKKNYFKRKTCEFVFLWGTLICICFIYNNDSRVINFNTYQTLNGSFFTKKKVKETPTHSNTISKKSIRKQLKELVRELRKNKASSASKTGLIILVLFGGIFLTLLLLSLSCSLSCNGNEALAYVAFIGGLAAIIFLMVLGIKAVNKPYK